MANLQAYCRSGCGLDKRVLVLVAHADDMEPMEGDRIAKMAALGYEVREVIAINDVRPSDCYRPNNWAATSSLSTSR